MLTFTRRAVTLDEASGLTTETVTTITGSAIAKSSGEGDVYERMSLVRSESPLLLFSPTTYGDAVAPGDVVQWPENGPTFTVQSARHIAPDGVVIASYVVVSR